MADPKLARADSGRDRSAYSIYDEYCHGTIDRREFLQLAGAASCAQGRDVVRLDLDVVRRRSGSARSSNATVPSTSVNRSTVTSSFFSVLFRAFDQIGEVEVLRESYDTKGWLLED